MAKPSIKEQLKTKKNINRSDIAELLKSVGKPGQKHKEKVEAIRELNIRNFQGVNLADALDDYEEF